VVGDTLGESVVGDTLGESVVGDTLGESVVGDTLGESVAGSRMWVFKRHTERRPVYVAERHRPHSPSRGGGGLGGVAGAVLRLHRVGGGGGGGAAQAARRAVRGGTLLDFKNPIGNLESLLNFKDPIEIRIELCFRWRGGALGGWCLRSRCASGCTWATARRTTWPRRTASACARCSTSRPMVRGLQGGRPAS
jgi:hypothetical protein